MEDTCNPNYSAMYNSQFLSYHLYICKQRNSDIIAEVGVVKPNYRVSIEKLNPESTSMICILQFTALIHEGVTVIVLNICNIVTEMAVRVKYFI